MFTKWQWCWRICFSSNYKESKSNPTSLWVPFGIFKNRQKWTSFQQMLWAMIGSSFWVILFPFDPPLVPDKVFDNHSGSSSVVLSRQKNNCVLGWVCDVVSLWSSSVSSRGEAQSDTKNVPECVFVCLLVCSVLVLFCSSFIQVSCLPSHSSVPFLSYFSFASFFVSPVFPSHIFPHFLLFF